MADLTRGFSPDEGDMYVLWVHLQQNGEAIPVKDLWESDH